MNQIKIQNIPRAFCESCFFAYRTKVCLLVLFIFGLGNAANICNVETFREPLENIPVLVVLMFVEGSLHLQKLQENHKLASLVFCVSWKVTTNEKIKITEDITKYSEHGGQTDKHF